MVGDEPELPESSLANGHDPNVLPLTPESIEYLADRKWVNEEHNLGHWDAYAGGYIAVAGKRFLGSGHDPVALRERVAGEHKLPPGRIVINYVDPGIES